ncbi:MAG: hypothetical protein K0U41_05695, partial [Gammaproteobacteria bacterium]|nr:hypothetical protein [Gammaproteobacteria bacterium]
PIQATVEITSDMPVGVGQKLTFVVDAGDLSYFNKISYSLSPTDGFVPITAESAIIFNSDMKSQTIYFLPVDNNIAEMDASIYRVKVKFEGQEKSLLLGSLTVENEDTAGIMVIENKCTDRFEADGNCTFKLKSTSEPITPLIVSFTKTPEDDDRVTVPAGKFIFSSTDWETPQLVIIAINNDNMVQPDPVHFSIAINNAADESNLREFNFMLTEDNAEIAGITLLSPGNTCKGTLSEEVVSCRFYIQPSSEPTGSVTVNFDSITDSRITVPEIVFDSENWTEQQEVILAIKDDKIAQDDILMISIIATADGYTDSNELSFMLTSEDTADITLTEGMEEGNCKKVGVSESMGNCTFSVRLATQPTKPVTLTATKTTDDDRVIVDGNGIFTFDSTNWNEDQDITLTIIDNKIDQDEDVSITITVSDTTASDDEDNLNPRKFTFILTEDDSAGITLTTGDCTTEDSTIRSEADGNCMFNVSLTSEPKSPVTVTFIRTPANTSGDTRLGTLSDVIFQPSEWSTPKPVTLTITGDDIAQSPSIVIGIEATATDYTTEKPLISFTLTSDDTASIELLTATCMDRVFSENPNTSCFFYMSLNSEPTEPVTVTFTTTPADTRVTVPEVTFNSENWSRQQKVILTITDDHIAQEDRVPIGIQATAMAYTETPPAIISFTLTNEDIDTDGDKISDAVDVDHDNDGLIEISSLEMLHNMRNDLDGTHYNNGTTSSNAGCPTSGCNGYELTTNLNFDIVGNDGTFIPTKAGDCDVIIQGDNPDTPGVVSVTETAYPRIDDYAGCKIDAKDHNATYFNVATDGSGGWLPIGDCGADRICRRTYRNAGVDESADNNSFTAIFDGNDFTISNMSIKISSDTGSVNAGLFGYTDGATIRNIGMVGGIVISSASASSYSSYSTSGGLVGASYGGSISNSYATGNVSSGSSTSTSKSSTSGGLVGGASYGGSISSSYATGNVSSASYYSYSTSGGLVGWTSTGSISNSYATGNV